MKMSTGTYFVFRLNCFYILYLHYYCYYYLLLFIIIYYLSSKGRMSKRREVVRGTEAGRQ